MGDYTMAKISNRFSAKGELYADNLVVYEVKNKGKEDEYLEEIDLLGFLREFHGRSVSISISEDREVFSVTKEIKDDEVEEG